MLNISVVGAGYVGLVTAACLAEVGHRVTCIDTKPTNIDKINRGESPIHEPGLTELLERNAGSRLTATTDMVSAIRRSDVTFLAVGTPYDRETKAIDLGQVETAARQIGAILRDKDAYHLVVIKSTVVPGTTRDLIAPLIAETSGRTLGTAFDVAMNPEFLREGFAVEDFMHPDRIVLGCDRSRALAELKAVYAPFAGTQVIPVNSKTAEMIKYGSNALLATLISFSNDLANMCQAFRDIDANEVMAGLHGDKRLNPFDQHGERTNPEILDYLKAGCGFGGSCLPKDVHALRAHARRHQYDPKILSAVLAINREQPSRLVELLKRRIPILAQLPITVLGLAFKAGTDDLRESPAITVISALREEGAKVHLYDPVTKPPPQLGEITVHDALEPACRVARAIVLVTAWPQFQQLPQIISRLDPQPWLIDGRRAIDNTAIRNYMGIGL